ncbi:hypothetical protein F5141DRAFT_1063630 [Pisolithus sp. B1]|nr:hypothetical protein F5141DRAFT_1063630 [Pisolithus sp. B1]
MVSVAEEYNKFMAPIICAKVWSIYQSKPSEPAVLLPMPIEYYTGSDEINMDTCTQDFTIPFLPLPHMFDCTDPQQWDILSKEIECWLVNEVQNSSLSIWMWGRDAFWLAFIGANPTFPSGRWSAWDPRIPLEGTFIEEWLSGHETESLCLEGLSDSDQNDDCHNTGSAATPPDCSSTLSYILDLFSRHIALFYPQPLISAI